MIRFPFPFFPAADKAAAFFMVQDSFLLLTHKNPDGDTVGSAAGLCAALKLLGKEAALLPDPDAGAKFLSYYRMHLPNKTEYKTIVSVDVASPELLTAAGKEFFPRLNGVLDHHLSRFTAFQGETFCDAGAAACAELVCEICLILFGEIPAACAEPLYMGLMTDTGCFRYSNTTPKTHYYASLALAAGAPGFSLVRTHFIKKTPGHIRASGFALSHMETLAEGKLSRVIFTWSDREMLNVDEDDLGGIVQEIASPEECEVAILLKETREGDLRFSLRSDQYVDVAAVAEAFGGGGHKRAAGCTLRGLTPTEAMDLVSKEALKAL